MKCFTNVRSIIVIIIAKCIACLKINLKVHGRNYALKNLANRTCSSAKENVMKVKTSGDYFPNMLVKLLISKFKDKLTFLNFGNKKWHVQRQLN